MNINTLPIKSTKWQCGFCSGGNHDRCVRAVVNQGSILRCACKADHSVEARCLECGNINPD